MPIETANEGDAKRIFVIATKIQEQRHKGTTGFEDATEEHYQDPV